MRWVKAFENLKKHCEEQLKCVYQIEVIDVMINPKPVRGEQILAN